MARLAIRLLGPLQITLDGVEASGFDSNKVRALLSYLIVESDRPHSRSSLAALLWPDSSEASAQANLRHVLSNLRKVIGDQTASPPFLQISRQSIQFNRASDVWCDVLAFSQGEKGLGSQSSPIQNLEDRLNLYRGCFLEGFSINRSIPFEEWALLERERLQRLVVSILTRLISTCYQLGEREKALRYAWQLVELEPWREASWQHLIRLLSFYGRRGEALAQFEACRSALDKELGVEPSPETIALYECIRDGTSKNGEAWLSEGASPSALPPDTRSASIHPLENIALVPQRSGIELNRPSRITRPGLLMIASAILVSVSLLFWSGLHPRRPTPETPALGTSAMQDASLQSLGGQVPAARMVFTCEGLYTPEICIRDPETGWVSQLTGAGVYKAFAGFSWSPDGEQIVFSALKPGKSTAILFLMAADGSSEKPVMEADFEGQFPSWSPDGEWIAFSQKNHLWLARPDGSLAHRLVKGQSNEIAAIETSWSPDGRRIAFFKQTASPTGITSQVWAVERDGTLPRLVRSFNGKVHGLLGWSPDGNRIACFCAREDTGGGIREDTLIFNADGQGDVQHRDVPPQTWFPSYWPQWQER